MATPTFYLIHGEDDFRRKEWLHTLQAKMNDPAQMNISILDGSETDAGAVIGAVSAYPFLSDKRLVIVKGLLSELNKRSGGRAELTRLAEELPKLPDFARLVFHESKAISDKNPVLQAARSSGVGYEKLFDVPKNPAQWIMRHAEQEHDIKIEGRAAAALAGVINGDLRAADSELAKLAAYVDYARPITEDDVATLTTYVAEANIFDMVDALGLSDGKTALQLTQKLLIEGSEPLALLGMINRQFRLLIMAREYLDETGSAAGLEKAIGVHPFVAQKLGQQAQRFQSLAHLIGIYHKLAELDDQVKTGRIRDEVALHLLIAGVTS